MSNEFLHYYCNYNQKKLSNQIRGIKGNKYYQSNKAYGYGNGNFCTLRCYDEWSNIYLDRAIDTIGVRITEPVKVNMENAWLVASDYNYNNSEGTRWTYFLVNKLYNVKYPITKAQASIHPNEEYSPRLSSAQAKELAEQLGLTQQQ